MKTYSFAICAQKRDIGHIYLSILFFSVTKQILLNATSTHYESVAH